MTGNSEKSAAAPANVLSCCLVEDDAAAMACARRLRRQALLASLALECALLAVLILCPLLATGERIRAYTVVLRPPYYGTPHGNQNAQAGPRGPQRDTHLKLVVIYQPPRIPTTGAPNHGGAPSSQSSCAEVGPPSIGDLTSFLPPVGATDPHGYAPPRPPTPVGPFAEHKTRVKQSEGVQEALLVRRIEPTYPRIAVTTRIEGTVRLRAIIARDGRVTSLELLSGHPLLARAAMEAVSQWRYRPTLLNGVPVEVETYITVIFTLSK